MNKFQNIYAILHKEYGPQGWWPLTPDGETRTKHHSGNPKSEQHRFEIMLGAILTQNTAWTNVEKALEQLHKNKLVHYDKILSTKKEKLASLIRSAGYYNQKAERLAIISRFVKEHTIKGLMKKDTAALREMLLSVKGIGPETADSIVLYAFEKPSFVIDAYTKRIFSRIGICAADVDYHELQKMFMDSIRKDVDVYKEYHALIVEHAKQHCRTKPGCKNCPLGRLCMKRI
jgi:endonuclease-3 related protein